MKKIIVADDSATARMFVKRCMEIAGCRDDEFIEVANGEEALRALQQTNADIVVTDLNMPIMDGEELLRKIRENDQWAAIPVLVITSAQNPAKEQELKALRATAVIPKPVSPAQMLAILKAL